MAFQCFRHETASLPIGRVAFPLWEGGFATSKSRRDLQHLYALSVRFADSSPTGRAKLCDKPPTFTYLSCLSPWERWILPQTKDGEGVASLSASTSTPHNARKHPQPKSGVFLFVCPGHGRKAVPSARLGVDSLWISESLRELRTCLPDRRCRIRFHRR